MRFLPRLCLASLVSCSVELAGCSDDGEAPATTPLTVWVLEEALVLGDAPAPIANTEVAFDPPGGGARVLAKTAADGRVVFTADFTRGGGAVSVVSPDHVLFTALDASPGAARRRPNRAGKPAEDLVLTPPPLDRVVRDRTLELRGSFIGKREESTVVDLSTSALRRLGSDATSLATYALRIPRARAVFLIGHELGKAAADGSKEHIKSFRIDLPPRDADGSLDLDLGATPVLADRVVHLRAPLPGGPFSGATRGTASIVSADSKLLLGAFARATPTADAIDIEVVVAETDIAPESVYTRATLVAPDGASAVRAEPGIVADSASLDGFLIPPSVAEASRRISDPIPIEGLPPNADVRIDVYAGDQLLWVLTSGPDGLTSPTLKLPAPLIRFSADVALLAIAITVRADAVTLPSGTEIYRREATSRDVLVRR